MSKKKRLKVLFPLWTIEPTPKNLADHLHGKTERFKQLASSSFPGEANSMEKQLIDRIEALQQQVSVVTNVVQALLIIEDERISQKLRRTASMLVGGTRKLWDRIRESTAYKVYAVVIALAAVALTWDALYHFAAWLLHRL